MRKLLDLEGEIPHVAKPQDSQPQSPNAVWQKLDAAAKDLSSENLLGMSLMHQKSSALDAEDKSIIHIHARETCHGIAGVLVGGCQVATDKMPQIECQVCYEQTRAYSALRCGRAGVEARTSTVAPCLAHSPHAHSPHTPRALRQLASTTRPLAQMLSATDAMVAI